MLVRSISQLLSWKLKKMQCCNFARPYLDGIVPMRCGGGVRTEEAAPFENPEREHNLRVRGGVPEPGGLDTQHLPHRHHCVVVRLAQAVLEQHRHHCTPHDPFSRFTVSGGRGETESMKKKRRDSERCHLGGRGWTAHRGRGAHHRRRRRSSRRPRRRRNEKPAAASRRPHRSDSARSRYMRLRSDAVGCQLASASGIALLLCHCAPAARGDAPVSLIPRHELGWETGTGERSRVAHFSSSPVWGRVACPTVRDRWPQLRTAPSL
jgi:hypothetical protein